MAAFEGSFKSLLMGVSQQVARERLPGQVSVQDNMLSDTVTNLRRRPGVEYSFELEAPGATVDNIRGWYTDIGGSVVHVLLNGGDGTVSLLDEDFNVDASLAGGAYLTADRARVQAAAVGQEFFLANTGIKPTPTRSNAAANARRGFFFVRQGAFSKRFSVSVKVDGTVREYGYTTPDGTGSGDAAASSAEQIAAHLRDDIFADLGVSGVDVRTAGACIYLFANSSVTQLVVTTDTSNIYMVASNDQKVRLDTDLPPSMHSAANGLIIRTGADKASVYYRYDFARSAWLEDGVPGGVSSISDVPVSIRRNPDTEDWELLTTPFEGRLSGDDDTNGDPAFLENGITGIGAYQNRLVVLAGPMVDLSDSRNPRRMYRTTTTTLVDTDTIHVGASANSSAAYQHCLPFQKDLLLFSEQYQALIPSGNTALTPRNATVVVTSTYAADMTSAPIPLGRTVMYPTPRSKSFFGVKEMLPSPYTDSQYVSYDVTQHLPTYLPRRCRFSVSSSVANMALFAPTGDKRSLIVHEYLWSGDDKVQQAWHRWTFPYEVADAYFANDLVVILFVQNDRIIGCTLDPRQGYYTDTEDRRPFMDMYSFVDVEDNLLTIPEWLLAFDPDVAEAVKLSVADGELAGEPVGFYTTDDPAVLRTVRSFPNGRVAIGLPYRSTVSPTAPMVQDQNGVKISSNKLTVLRYMISTNMSREYEVLIRDARLTDAEDDQQVGALYWTSRELDPGTPRVGGDSTAIVPCRTAADSTVLLVYTEGLGELNIIGMEYMCRYNQRLTRR